MLTAFAADLARLQRAAPPIALVQVARYANPQNSSATMLLALLLETQDRADEALALLRTIPRDDALSGQVRDVQVKILTDSKRFNEAYAIASAAATRRDANVSDLSRLGDVYQAMKRYNEAADAYGRARRAGQCAGPQGRTLAAAAAAGQCARAGRTAGPRPRRRCSRRWRSRPTSRCCSISWAMPSSSGARTWTPPKR